MSFVDQLLCIHNVLYFTSNVIRWNCFDSNCFLFHRYKLDNYFRRLKYKRDIFRYYGNIATEKKKNFFFVMAHPRRRRCHARGEIYIFIFPDINFWSLFSYVGNGTVPPTRKRRIRQYRIHDIEKNTWGRYQWSRMLVPWFVRSFVGNFRLFTMNLFLVKILQKKMHPRQN